ncbi:hypothetical protein OA2633_02386 [Oceanicaulis sp. HTCC2633]|nr:hypothetical protein OA2633_02386 [Oceanicaulis sp. HTCC2633]
MFFKLFSLFPFEGMGFTKAENFPIFSTINLYSKHIMIIPMETKTDFRLLG